MSRADVISTIRTHLEGMTIDSAAYFGTGKVRQDRPLGLQPFDGQCIFYSTGDGELPDAYRNGTFRTRFLAERFVVKVFWLPTPMNGKREARLQEQWDVRRGITALLVGDSQLGGNVSDLKIRSTIQDSETYGPNDSEWDVLTITFDVWDLTGEAISA